MKNIEEAENKEQVQQSGALNNKNNQQINMEVINKEVI